MRHKGLIIFLTAAVSVLCIYYLSFTFVGNRVRNEAVKHATDASGKIDLVKKQAYLDNILEKPVYNLLGLKYTYEQVREQELSLGLDLVGGLMVTLEVSPEFIVEGLVARTYRDKIKPVLEEALRFQKKNGQSDFLAAFYKVYQQKFPNQKLRDVFASAANRGRVTYKSTDEDILKLLRKEVNQAVDRSFNILQARLDQFGTSSPNIQRLPNSARIQVELPGVQNQTRVKKQLQGAAKLSFWNIYDPQKAQDIFVQIEEYLQKEQMKISKESKTKNQVNQEEKEKKQEGSDADFKSPFFALAKGWWVAGPRYSVKDKEVIRDILRRKEIQKLIPKDMVLMWDAKASPINKDKLNEKAVALYALKKNRKGQGLLEGDVITNASQMIDQNGKPAVEMHMNGIGTRKWKRITAQNIGKGIAIVLDDLVYSAPTVTQEIPNGISSISGSFSIQEAKDLAAILKAGSFPAPVKIVEYTSIGATLGKAAQTQGFLSMLIGLVLVVLFMVFYYAKGGAVAVGALLFNMLFILGVLAQLGASLTLPGIAGIVLTIGMSIDANVLIFERIREELKQGANIKTAIEIGYKKAYSSIIDSNITTFLTGAILYLLGQGLVRGFATTLMIGIISSFFSAVFITRVIIIALLGDSSTDHERISFSFPFTRDLLTNLKIDFLGMRKITYLISLIFIVIGGIFMARQGGLNWGVDFTGGRFYILEFGKAVNPTKIKENLAADKINAEVKTYGSDRAVKITTNYLIDDDSSDADKKVRSVIINSIMKRGNLQEVKAEQVLTSGTFMVSSNAKIGATIAGDIKNSAKKSILLSLIMIFLYILVRFRRLQFGVASILALIHDTLTVLAAFAIARAFGFVYEIDQVFVAAMLTVIGYSINDTVVVFDRVRERLHMQSGESFAALANKSINDTISRTFITSLTTFIAVFTLFLFGGEVLRGFSFALLIGIIFGTYSSVFIATPLVVDFSKKK